MSNAANLLPVIPPTPLKHQSSPTASLHFLLLFLFACALRVSCVKVDIHIKCTTFHTGLSGIFPKLSFL